MAYYDIIGIGRDLVIGRLARSARALLHVRIGHANERIYLCPYMALHGTDSFTKSRTHAHSPGTLSAAYDLIIVLCR